MAACVQCTTAVTSPSGHILVNWSDGTQTEYQNLVGAYDAAGAVDTDEQAKLRLVARWLKNDPAAAHPEANINGRTCILNVGAQYEVQVV